MKFRRINIHNLHELVPRWAIDPFSLGKTLDRLFDNEGGIELFPVRDAVYRSLKFWVEVDATLEQPGVRICTPDDKVNLSGHLVITCHSLAHERAQIDLPLNPIFKGYESIAGKHSVYLHSFQTDVPLGYVGLTKRRWFDRYSQHLSSAKAGSPYLFHQALREHLNTVIMHKVFMNDLSRDHACQYEEEYVGMFGLYPKGLNMIPGGKAGFAYLSKLGLQARNFEERDAIVENLSARTDLEGRPNPLCAARWATDPDFAERVICGHTGRLTAEQVVQIRRGASIGISIAELLADVAARNERQVRNVIAGKTYGRIRPD